LMIRSSALRPVDVLAPKALIPKRCRTGRHGQRPSLDSSISSKTRYGVTVYRDLPMS
jgi:hypothetical protein